MALKQLTNATFLKNFATLKNNKLIKIRDLNKLSYRSSHFTYVPDTVSASDGIKPF